MKKILLLVSLMVVSFFAYSQEANTATGQIGRSPLNKGEKQINFGLGLDTDGLPVYAQLDFAVSPVITVSPMIALTSGYDISYSTIGVHSDYHFNRIMGIPSNWDFYAGLNLGFRVFFGARNGTTPLDLGIQVGGRYYWNRNWGVNLELGGGAGFGGRVGVSKRL